MGRRMSFYLPQEDGHLGRRVDQLVQLYREEGYDVTQGEVIRDALKHYFGLEARYRLNAGACTKTSPK